MQKLIDIVEKLRSPEGCPWDRKQTHASLIDYLLEETWEVIEEIESKQIESTLKEELGDLLLQIVLHAQIAKEENRFDIDDVINIISKKMINRHPHVFGNQEKSLTDKELRSQWLKIKNSEKPDVNKVKQVSASAPALLNALTISKKAAGMGFDWETPWDVLLKVEEELEEVRTEMEQNNVENIEEEIGDLLFTITKLARFYKINPEVALKKGNEKFMARFVTVEKAIVEAEQKGEKLTLQEMETHWKSAK